MVVEDKLPRRPYFHGLKLNLINLLRTAASAAPLERWQAPWNGRVTKYPAEK